MILREIQKESNEAVKQVGTEVERVLEKVEAYGREKPVALALAALTVGIAAGLLFRRALPDPTAETH